MIVPRSSTLITQDSDYALFNVTLFKKVVEEFKLHAREKKFVVREFTYNEEEMAAGKNEITKLVTDKKKQFGPLVRWLKVNFSETFCAWIHVKALRVFVESVLRYVWLNDLIYLQEYFQSEWFYLLDMVCPLTSKQSCCTQTRRARSDLGMCWTSCTAIWMAQPLVQPTMLM